MRKIVKNNFLKNTLPWILAAVLAVALPFVWNYCNAGYTDIVYSDGLKVTPRNTASVLHTQSETVTPDADKTPSSTDNVKETYVLVINKSSKKIHIDSCYHAKRISDDNKYLVETDDIANKIAELLQEGYSACNTCCKVYTDQQRIASVYMGN